MRYWWDVKWYVYFSKQWFLKKLKIELPCDPAIPRLGIYLKELKAGFKLIVILSYS